MRCASNLVLSKIGSFLEYDRILSVLAADFIRTSRKMQHLVVQSLNKRIQTLALPSWRRLQHQRCIPKLAGDVFQYPSPSLLSLPLTARAFCVPQHRKPPPSSLPTPVSPLSPIPTSSDDNPAPARPSNWNIANFVTGFRFVLAPAVGALILSDHNSAALVVLSMAGASDALDGYLARRFHLQTPLGTVMDPAADKLLIACAAGALCVQGALPTWIVGLVIARDVGLVTVASCIPRERWLAPLAVSKANTALQIMLCVAGIASAGDLAVVDPLVVHGLAVATAATTSASGLMYAVRFWRALK